MRVGGIGYFSSATASTGTDSGSLIVTGGLGVSGNINVGGQAYIKDTTDSGGTDSGALIVSGGLGVGKSAFFKDTVTATSFKATSDYRIKDNVVDLDSNYNVDKLRPVKYRNKISDKDDIGFIAHEVGEIYPFLVSGEKDGEINQSLNYIGLIGILVKEIQELKKEIMEIKRGME